MRHRCGTQPHYCLSPTLTCSHDRPASASEAQSGCGCVDDITGQRSLLLTCVYVLGRSPAGSCGLCPVTPVSSHAGQAALLKYNVRVPVNRNQIRFPVGALSSASNVSANVPCKLVALSTVEDYVPGFSKAAGLPSASAVMTLAVARSGHIFIFWSVSMENRP